MDGFREMRLSALSRDGSPATVSGRAISSGGRKKKATKAPPFVRLPSVQLTAAAATKCSPPPSAPSVRVCVRVLGRSAES